jgi:hypothetical protein
MKIKDISKTAPKIINTSKCAERVDPGEVAKAIGAESFSDIERLIRSKVEEAIERTTSNDERHQLVCMIMNSAKSQLLIRDWTWSRLEDMFVYEIQVSFPMWPRLYITVPFVKE